MNRFRAWFEAHSIPVLFVFMAAVSAGGYWSSRETDRKICEALNTMRATNREMIELSIGDDEIPVEDYPEDIQPQVRQSRERQRQFLIAVEPVLARKDC